MQRSMSSFWTDFDRWSAVIELFNMTSRNNKQCVLLEIEYVKKSKCK